MKFRSLIFVTAMLVAQSSNAADPEFMGFVLKKAHERGFTQCDAAIKDAFPAMGGSDIRVITQDGHAADSMKIVAVYGNTGDVTYSEAEFRRFGSKCKFTKTTTVVSTNSCIAELGGAPMFKYESETAGVTFTRNAGGVNMILMPVGTQGCTAIFLRGGEA